MPSAKCFAAIERMAREHEPRMTYAEFVAKYPDKIREAVKMDELYTAKPQKRNYAERLFQRKPPNITKTCTVCGKEFHPLTASGCICSEACRKQIRSERQKAARANKKAASDCNR